MIDFISKRFLATCSILFLVLPNPASSNDWPQWRGPNRDGVSTETGLLTSWPEGGPPQLWKANGIGGGYSSPAIEGGKVFGTGYVDGEEIVWALSAEDGKEIWKTVIGKANYEEIDAKYAVGPRATPTIDGDHLYFLGAAGALACLEKESGKLVWSHNLAVDYGGELMSEWGFSEAPLIDGEHLICTPGGARGTVAALHKKNWRAGLAKQRFHRSRFVQFGGRRGNLRQKTICRSNRGEPGGNQSGGRGSSLEGGESWENSRGADPDYRGQSGLGDFGIRSGNSFVYHQ